MKKNILKLSILAVAAAVSIPALAAGDSVSGPNPFSDCGIGAALFQDTAWAAVTSNVTWDLGTTAVTSATMSPNTCTKRNVKAAMFIRDSYAQIVEDAARGTGDHLAATLEMFDCGAAQQGAALNEVRNGVGGAVTAPGYGDQKHLEKAGQLFKIIDGAARNNCAA